MWAQNVYTAHNLSCSSTYKFLLPILSVSEMDVECELSVDSVSSESDSSYNESVSLLSSNLISSSFYLSIFIR